MKAVYSSENPSNAAIIKAQLERENIPCLIKNEFGSGGAGELPPVEVWPEVWILDDTQYERASELVLQVQQGDSEPKWICNYCREPNEASFESCWKCRNDRIN